jgi:CRISPR-associated protein Cas1
MGLEGEAARHAFRVLGQSLRSPWVWQARARRPPPDPVNCIISVLSTLLHENCYAALHAVGLDPACGFLHAPKPGRAALALDLMEEFRPLIIDSLVLTLLNKRMLREEHFVPGPRSGTYLSQEGWRVVATAFARRMQTLVTLPGRSRRISYQKVLEVQARAVRKAIMEDAPYEPFLAR